MSQQLIEHYINYTLTHNKSPESVYLFSKEAGITEAEFYTFYASLSALEAAIFAEWWKNTSETAAANEVYKQYSAREKILALFFTWIEKLKSNLSFVLYLFNRDTKKFPADLYPNYLKKLHHEFTETVKPILGLAIENKEISDR